MKILIAIGLIILMGGFSEFGMAKATDTGRQASQQKQVAVKDKALKNLTSRGKFTILY